MGLSKQRLLHGGGHPGQLRVRKRLGLVHTWRAGVEGGDPRAWARYEEGAVGSSIGLNTEPTGLASGLDVGSQGECPEEKTYRPEYKEGRVRFSTSAISPLRLRTQLPWKSLFVGLTSGLAGP